MHAPPRGALPPAAARGQDARRDTGMSKRAASQSAAALDEATAESKRFRSALDECAVLSAAEERIDERRRKGLFLYVENESSSADPYAVNVVTVGFSPLSTFVTSVRTAWARSAA